MKIIDNKKDFYDYIQYIYPDDSIVFDRRDSYNLSRKEFSKYIRRFYYNNNKLGRYVLLQVNHTFWLFKLVLLKEDSIYNASDPDEYTINLLESWKDYNADEALIKMSSVGMSLDELLYVEKLYGYKEFKKTDLMVIESVKRGEYKTHYVFDEFDFYIGSKHEKRHIPLLCNIGISGLIDPIDVYTALEEYFEHKITQNERRESVDLTNDDKVTNHGFDLKYSFRGKQ